MKEQEILYKIKDEFEQILTSVSFVEINESLLEATLGNIRVDLILKLKINGEVRSILVESKSSGEPRIVRMAIQQLREYSNLIENAYPVVAAPFISEDTANLWSFLQNYLKHDPG